MKLFEATWRDGYQFFERYYDTNLNRSIKKEIKLPHEWYELSSKGLYSYILDDSIKLEKKQGNAKDGREQYGFLDPMYRNIKENYWDKDAYNLKPRVLYLDIETRVSTCSTGFPVPEKALEPISLIQIYDNISDTMIVLGLRPWSHQLDYKFTYTVKYIQCKDEIHLIQMYFDIFAKLDPLIIYAWNGAGFDFPYLFNRIKKLGLDVHKMSNYGKVSLSENEFQGKIDFKFKADGHFYIDLKVVYEKFTFDPRPSYALNAIAEIELGENKVDHSEFSAFDDFYTGKYNIPLNPTEVQKNSKIYKAAINGEWDEVKELAHSEFVYYGCVDTYLILRIDQKLNFTTLMNMIAEKMGVQIGDALGTVKPWAQFLCNRSIQDMKVMPCRTEHDDAAVVGGFVREPVTGKHKWVLSIDVNSMYPLLGMVGFNMSPETFVPKYKLPEQLRDIVLKYFNDQDEANRLTLDKDVWGTTTKLLQEFNLSLGINGAVFTCDKIGMIPELVQEIYNSRKKAKNTMLQYEKRKLFLGELINAKS